MADDMERPSIPETPYGASDGEARWEGARERNWRWAPTGEFSELCKRATCEAATDATHYHRPQAAHSGPTTPDRCPCGQGGPHSGCSWWRVEVTPDTDQDRSWQVLARREIRTIECRCGRPVTFDSPAWPMCVECHRVAGACTCSPVLAQAPTVAAIPTGALLEPGARVERPDLEGMLAEFNASQHQYRTPDGYRLARVIAYALQVEQDAAGLRKALKRWLVACDAFQEAEPAAWMAACSAELDLKTLARALLGAGS